MLGDLAHIKNLLDALGTKFDLGGKELDALVFVQGAVDKGGFNDTLLALSGLQETLGEAGTSHGHGECGGASAILCLDDFIAAKLDAIYQAVKLLASNVGVARLRDQGHDGDTGVTTNNSDVLVGGVGALDLRDESRGSDDIKGSDTEQTLWVIDSLALEDFCNNRDGRVDLSTDQYDRRRRLVGGKHIQDWR